MLLVTTMLIQFSLGIFSYITIKEKKNTFTFQNKEEDTSKG